MATSEQIDLLGRMQAIGHFKHVNPLAVTEDEAEDLFKSLPALEIIEAEALNKNGERVTAEFIGVSEYDTKKQLDKWIEQNDFVFEHKSQPDYVNGLVWLDYFRQPVDQVNLKTLEKTFEEWNLPTSANRFPIAFEGITPEKFAEIQGSRAGKEQYAILRDYVIKGKMDALPKDAYMKLTQREAQDLIEKYKNASEKIQPAVRTEHFPEYKAINLVSNPKASYVQIMVLRDLLARKAIGTDENRAELGAKLKYVTKDQAEKLLEPFNEERASWKLLQKLRVHVVTGDIQNIPDEKLKNGTNIDVIKIFETSRAFDYLKQGVVKDLISNNKMLGYESLIVPENAIKTQVKGKPVIKMDTKADPELMMSKVPYLTGKQLDNIINRFSGEPMGKNLAYRVNEVIESGRIGEMERSNRFFKVDQLSIKEGLNIVQKDEEYRKAFSKEKASDGQIKALERLAAGKSIDLSKEDMSKMTYSKASKLIEAGIAGQQNKPATEKQKNMLKLMVENKFIPSIPYNEWKTLSVKMASDMIASVPKEKLDSLFASFGRSRTVAPARQEAMSR